MAVLWGNYFVLKGEEYGNEKGDGDFGCILAHNG